ncbi:nicotinate phosphoribosyltransferase [Salinimicrobium oceani]|uniref:Nicotinate phosphoribosyltransferase n=1 Tax=Salinimicrobium oceani TaxID=2722702 RepID=A0ABX1D6C9_9FLAO|nr:nicotinate phosphoribosyltransferase [Salinimicrobium oceani]NJW54131.1 nicotinate phosphoribosyltransferase [Salinimicrobium oceani]
MIDFSGTYTDQYQLAMGQVYFKKGDAGKIAIFDYFFRKLPFDGGFAVFAGLETLLDILENFSFSEQDLNFLEQQGFDAAYLSYLEDFRFRGKVYSMKEGDLVFPGAPVVRIEANIVEAQIVETVLLNILNFQTLIATKATRMEIQAKGRKLIDFGLRRAQGTGGYHASRAAVIGGFDATSNTRAGRDFHIPVSGTMGHSFIQSYGDELEAFRAFAEVHPKNSILLVDTYDTLRSGVPNAITVAREMESRGERLKGIRLDSGDLAYLARRSREKLDAAGLDYVKISVSNQLDEHLIKSLIDQEAPIDIFGVGTSLVTGKPDAALDGVYKLAFFKDEPRIKLSETISKVTLPHRKQVFRLLDESGNFLGADVVCLAEEAEIKMMYHPYDPLKFRNVSGVAKEPLLQLVMEDQKRIHEHRDIREICEFRKARLQKLAPEYKRFFNPHIYKVGLSESLRDERNALIDAHKAQKK